ncbi:MAG: alpha/beta fold hydrolase [Candidatus Hodarchaeales archaeon]|jgi:pimeloyl-ACP methyl ester carboxylesterase
MKEFFDEIEDIFIDTNGIKLHTVMIGSGKPLILLHGFPDFWYGWKNIINGLKDRFRLIIPDLRGYNLSDKPKNLEDYDLEILVEDIKGITEELNLDKVVLAGHDWGGVIAWAFAEKYPDILKKLIILNAPHPKIFQETLRTDKEQQKASFYIFKFLQEGADFLLEDDYLWLRRAVFDGMINKENFTEYDKKKYIEAWSQPSAIVSGVNYYLANLNFDDWTGIFDVPTLLIWGMKDTALLPQQLDGINAYVKDLKVVKSENSSHWIMHDDPELVNGSIQSFIENEL